jgi:hypothetical protein
MRSRFHAEMRTMGRKVTTTIEWTAYERPRRLASLTRLSGMDIRGDLRFDPVAGGHQDAVGVGRGAARWSQADGTDDHPDGPTPGADHMVQPEACPGSTRSHRPDAAEREKGSVQMSRKLREGPVDPTGLMVGRSSGCSLVPPTSRSKSGGCVGSAGQMRVL